MLLTNYITASSALNIANVIVVYLPMKKLFESWKPQNTHSTIELQGLSSLLGDGQRVNEFTQCESHYLSSA
jgi:hypothetical protein